LTSPISSSSLSDVLKASGAGSTGTSSRTNSGSDLGKDAFMKLMVAQLKYQDPSSPSDGTQFLAQTAQFTMVEKLSDLADSQEKLLSGQQQMLTAQLQLGASNMIGKTVNYTDATGAAKTGIVTGATISGSNPTVKIGNTDVALSNVTEVRSTTTA
jgi:flagellar basal-body rod modification protein FlgD